MQKELKDKALHMCKDHEWVVQFPELEQQYEIPIKPFLGEEDARNEWAHNRNPEGTFLHTNSYKKFQDKDCLYIFGRRGTGKTAMMRMLQYEVNMKRITDYSYVHIVDSESAYNDLSIHLRLSPFNQVPENELVHLLIPKWLWVLNVSAMIAVVTAKNKKQKAGDDIATIKKYLEEQQLLDPFPKNPVERLTKIITDELDAVEYLPMKVGSAVIKIARKLKSQEYEKSYEALIRILKRSKGACLVLVDSIELYNLNDSISRAVNTALIEATRKIYEERFDNNILVKVAFPSEIYPHLSPMNKDKTMGRNLFIHWRYRDLVTFLAKRYWQMVHKNSNHNGSVVLDELNDFHAARDFIYHYLPEQILTSSHMSFDTLAYIIRHTHKKPRQVITLFNIIFTYAEELGVDLLKHKIPVDVIVKGTHVRLALLTEGTLDIFVQIYPKACQIVKRALTGTKSYFDSSTLDELLKEVSSLRNEEKLSRDDVKRLFLESGVLGLCQKKYYLTTQKKEFLLALFEYQVKGTLTITNKDLCVIHPMFYQELQTVVDMNTFTYPVPAEDVEKQTLVDAGIQLG
jgi:hypothetical protein